MENRREFDLQLAAIDKKLDEHGETLEFVRRTLSTIAVQSVQITNLQDKQSEIRSDVSDIYGKLEVIHKWQASCPRSSISSLWACFFSAIGALTAAFTAHLFGGK